MEKFKTKWECIMNPELEKVLNQMVNLLITIEKKISIIESKIDTGKDNKKRVLNG